MGHRTVHLGMGDTLTAHLDTEHGPFYLSYVAMYFELALKQITTPNKLVLEMDPKHNYAGLEANKLLGELYGCSIADLEEQIRGYLTVKLNA
jgi:hypothetical protein